MLINLTDFDDPEFVRTWAPAAMVMSQRYIQWQLRQDPTKQDHIYGLTSLAPALVSLLVAHDDWRNPGYSIYRSRDALSVPRVVARYIDAYWQSLG